MSIRQNIAQVKELITQAELSAQRPNGSVLLLAVSKQQSAEAINTAYQLGISDFGENYFQEAKRKITLLKNTNIRWHFIGPIQSNKAKGIAASFSWVHSLDRWNIAQQLNKYRSDSLTPLNVCIQVNLTHEETKAGVSPEEAQELVLAVSQLPKLKLRGLMTIPPPLKNEIEQYKLFQQLADLMNSLNTQLDLKMDTLSMGMSDDLIPAIKAGSTIVRIGQQYSANVQFRGQNVRFYCSRI